MAYTTYEIITTFDSTTENEMIEEYERKHPNQEKVVVLNKVKFVRFYHHERKALDERERIQNPKTQTENDCSII